MRRAARTTPVEPDENADTWAWNEGAETPLPETLHAALEGPWCLQCGEKADGPGPCTHPERVLWTQDAVSRPVGESVLRLTRAVAEWRAALRAFHALATREIATGRATLESAAVPPLSKTSEPAASETAPPAETLGVVPAVRRTRRRTRSAPDEQSVFAFARAGEPDPRPADQ